MVFLKNFFTWDCIFADQAQGWQRNFFESRGVAEAQGRNFFDNQGLGLQRHSHKVY